jgi:hypothetical protein
MNLNHIQAIEQILTKLPVRDCLAKVTVRSGHNTDIDFLTFGGSQRADFLFFNLA